MSKKSFCKSELEGKQRRERNEGVRHSGVTERVTFSGYGNLIELNCNGNILKNI